MNLQPKTTYAQSVLDGATNGIDAMPSQRWLDPTNIHDLAYYFRYPEWIFWQKLTRVKPDGFKRLGRMFETDGSVIHIANDGTAYAEARPADGTARPWRREEPKGGARTGKARRARLAAEREFARASS